MFKLHVQVSSLLCPCITIQGKPNETPGCLIWFVLDSIYVFISQKPIKLIFYSIEFQYNVALLLMSFICDWSTQFEDKIVQRMIFFSLVSSCYKLPARTGDINVKNRPCLIYISPLKTF